MLKTLALALTALTLGACATQTAAHGPPDGRDCFANREINGYHVIDDHHVSVSIGPGRAYIFGTTWNARDLHWSEGIAVRSTSDWICTGNGLGVEVIGGEPRQHYPITDIARAPPPPASGS